ncbi:unnamed protein product [Parajaminaea phylloscopi]
MAATAPVSSLAAKAVKCLRPCHSNLFAIPALRCSTLGARALPWAPWSRALATSARVHPSRDLPACFGRGASRIASPLPAACPRDSIWSAGQRRLFAGPSAAVFRAGALYAQTRHASTTSSPASPAPSPSAFPEEPTSKWVGYHSLFLALLVYTIIVVGGLTRLTESGLSITEWNPGFKGMWLPRSDDEWEEEWAKYRETPEFLLLNAQMSLDDFKSIYMWEWSHRILGRLIGVAYVVPAAFFVARGMVKSPFRSKLLLIGLGIGAQGAMGWYMVKSGLAAPEGTFEVSDSPTSHSDALAPQKTATPASWTPRVSHFRLAAHLGLAFLVYAGMLRTGLSVLRQYNLAKNVRRASGITAGPGLRERLTLVLGQAPVRRYHRFVGGVTALVFLTAMSGALVAGLDAGLVYNEFPTMGDGRIAPPLAEMFDERYARSAGSAHAAKEEATSSGSLIIHNMTQNPVTVQFLHRCLAVTTFAHAVALAWKTRNLGIAMRAASMPLPPAVPRLAYLAAAAATAQASLGIMTLIYMVPIELASAHQAGSVALLSVMLALWGTLRVPTAQGPLTSAKQGIAAVSAASSGSATATAAAAGAPRFARAMHTTVRPARNQPPRSAVGFQHRSLSTASPAGRNLCDLPDKVKLRTGPAGRLAKILPAREVHDITTRVGSSYGGNHSIEWLEAPRNLLIITKRNDHQIRKAMSELIAHVNARYPAMNVIVEAENAKAMQESSPAVITLNSEDRSLLAAKVDVVITLGGDGTILHASSLFDQSPVPPVLSFSMGTLGFLLPWHIESFEQALEDLLQSRVTLLLRMRLRQTLHDSSGGMVGGDESPQEVHLMNEVTLHRGRQPHMTTIDAFVNGNHLTQAISDGLIVASPTGSTAYSLSAGGPIVHPSVQSLLLTPICPRSLSFRPVLLPSDSTIQLKISEHSRSPAELTIDGREVRVVQPGQFLEISMSPYPIPCVNRSSSRSHCGQPANQLRSVSHEQGTDIVSARSMQVEQGRQDTVPERTEDDWASDINKLLRFNASFAGRGLLGETSTSDDDPPASGDDKTSRG